MYLKELIMLSYPLRYKIEQRYRPTLTFVLPDSRVKYLSVLFIYFLADVIRTSVSANRMACYSHLHKCTSRNVIRTCISANNM